MINKSRCNTESHTFNPHKAEKKRNREIKTENKQKQAIK
jgi:hypothetical protein